MIDRQTKFLIVGLGLMGGSYARGLKRRGYTVYAIDKNPDSIAFALQKGWIDRGATVDTTLIQLADAVVFGLYPHSMIQWIQAHQSNLKSGIFITDVSGVKCHIVDAVQALLRPDVEFIASHPMAGKEVSGVQNADDGMFLDANFLITPTERNTTEGIAFAKAFARILEFHHIAVLSLQEHDEMIGFVSQLTHAIAVSLMNCNDNPHLHEYTGDSFRDLTRIARINEVLWSELFFANQDVLIKEIDAFTAELQNLKDKLLNHDEAGLRALFVQSTQRRKRFDK